MAIAIKQLRKQVTHGTDPNHHFVLRDSNNVDNVDVVLLAKRVNDDLQALP